MRRLLFVTPFLVLLGAPHGFAADLPAKEQLDAAIRSYLLEHPDVIVEALQKYEAQQDAKREQAAAAALSERKDDLYDHPMTPVTGNPKGDVTIVEFFDYQCGYCKRTMQNVLDLQKEDPNIRFVWKELPILGPASQFAARAAMAAKNQNKYLEFHTAVMGARGRLTPEAVMQHAKAVGLDIDRLKTDMMSPEIDKYLRDTLELARQLGINGTPGFVIGSKLVPGAISKEQMKELVAAARKPS